MIRNHTKKRYNLKTFEEAFYLICNKYPLKYSQFDLMVHYLWKFKKDEYSRHLKDFNENKFIKHEIFKKHLSENLEVISIVQLMP